MSKLESTTKLLEWLYSDCNNPQLDSQAEEYRYRCFGDKNCPPLDLAIPINLANNDTDDILQNIRLGIRDGEYMDTLHNIYDPYAIFVGHTFGNFTKETDDHGVERKVFRLAQNSKDATYLYRELVWQCATDAPGQQSLHNRSVPISSYQYSIEMKMSGGMIGGIDITVLPIVRGIEGLVDDYFARGK